MSLYVQHGYGKGDKIDVVRERTPLGGVILSPADEEPSTLEATAAHCAGLDIEVLLDPQTYVYSITDGFARNHEANELAFIDCAWHLSPTEVQRHVAGVVEANRRLGTSAVIAPAPLQSGFEDAWSALSLSYARSTIEQADRPVLVSCVIHESAFADWSAVARWLDVMTTLEARGFYLVVAHDVATYPLSWDAARLANVLRAVYVLGFLNEYEVVWGYSDLPGVLGQAAGAAGFASGWFHGLRAFSPRKWVPQRGGRQANPRVLSTGLWAALDVTGEGLSVAGSSVADRAIPDASVLALVREPGGWTRKHSWIQHLVGLGEIALALPDGHPQDRLARVDRLLSESLTLMQDLDNEGVYLDTSHETRIRALRAAIDLMGGSGSFF